MLTEELSQFLETSLHANSGTVCVCVGRVATERMKFVRGILLKGKVKYTQCILNLFAYNIALKRKVPLEFGRVSLYPK